jgi:hypothetical protein
VVSCAFSEQKASERQGSQLESEEGCGPEVPNPLVQGGLVATAWASELVRDCEHVGVGSFQ